jgi:hypothetical protein
MEKTVFFIKRILITYFVCILGIVSYVIIAYFIEKVPTSGFNREALGYTIGVGIMFGALGDAPYNTIFIILLYFSNIYKELLTNIWYAIVESALFAFISNEAAYEIVNKLQCIYNNSSLYSERISNSWCFDWQGGFILTFLFLLVLIFIMKGVLKIWKGHEKHCSK